MDEQDHSFRLGGIAGALVPQEQLHIALVGPVLGAGQALGHFMHERAFQGTIAMSRIRQKANESRWVKGPYASWQQRTYTVFCANQPINGCEAPSFHPGPIGRTRFLAIRGDTCSGYGGLGNASSANLWQPDRGCGRA